jgi:hypothetical protein
MSSASPKEEMTGFQHTIYILRRNCTNLSFYSISKEKKSPLKSFRIGVLAENIHLVTQLSLIIHTSTQSR